MSDKNIPEGFIALDRDSPFSDLTGPYYEKLDTNGKHEVLGLRLRHEHLNKARMAHGGLFMTIADNAFGDAILAQSDERISFVTVSFSSEFLSAGHKDDELSVARNLYAILRDFDKQKVEYVYSESFETKNVGQAVMNRLIKAAGHKIVKLD